MVNSRLVLECDRVREIEVTVSLGRPVPLCCTVTACNVSSGSEETKMNNSRILRGSFGLLPLHSASPTSAKNAIAAKSASRIPRRLARARFSLLIHCLCASGARGYVPCCDSAAASIDRGRRCLIHDVARPALLERLTNGSTILSCSAESGKGAR